METRTTGAEGLLTVLRCGLERSSEQQTVLYLGDRSSYVGMSDIGRMLDCPRAALAGKLLKPATQESAEELRHHLILQRGHWFEQGIHQALTGYGFLPLSQLEIEVMHGNTPIKAHLDFTLAAGQPRPAVRILEVKSTTRIPSAVPESHFLQVGGQTALLKACWNEPVFNLVQDTGEVLFHKTFPEICCECLGITLPDASVCDVQGWILYLSMCDVKAFGPFLPEDTDLIRCLDMASEFWETMSELKEHRLTLDAVQTAHGLAPLCPSCLWRKDCPNFQGSYHPEWEEVLTRLMDLKTKRKELEEHVDELEEQLKVAYQLSHTVAGEWINTDNHVFRVIPQNGRITLDRKSLAHELSLALGEQDARMLIRRCEKQGEPFERLYTVSQ